MKRLLYSTGRLAQVAALLAMPSAIWAAEIKHSERGAIGIFLGSIVLFAAGFFLTRLISR